MESSGDDEREGVGGVEKLHGVGASYVAALPLLLLTSLSTGIPVDAPASSSPERTAGRHLNLASIQDVVNDYRARLSLPQEVRVIIVPTNPLVVSVEPLQDRDGPYLLSMQEDFLDLLAEDELRAVIAHELGHVWIYTHHPYLQTEALANRVAMRLVSREVLEHVYQKVWMRTGTKGDLAQFLGGR